MPKKSDNFLRGWTRQLREALDEGGELAYEAAELLDECADLIAPGTGDDEVGTPDDADGDDVQDDVGVDPDGDSEDHQRNLPGLAGDMAPGGVVPGWHNNTTRVASRAGSAVLSGMATHRPLRARG